MSLGFAEAGFSIIVGVDSDAWSCKTHAANFVSKTKEIEIGEIGDSKQFLVDLGVKRVDVVIGGPPCTGFARVGKGKINHLNRQARRYQEQDPHPSHGLGWGIRSICECGTRRWEWG